MQVVATKRGVYEGDLKEPGEVFEFDLEKFGKLPYKRDEKDALVRDDEGDPVVDEDGERTLPSWVVEATDEAVAEFSTVPLNHPALDEQNRPFLYTTPGAPPEATLPPNVESEVQRFEGEGNVVEEPSREQAEPYPAEDLDVEREQAARDVEKEQAARDIERELDQDQFQDPNQP
jgi:hypothetical protein